VAFSGFLTLLSQTSTNSPKAMQTSSELRHLIINVVVGGAKDEDKPRWGVLMITRMISKQEEHQQNRS
jgi:hypothetical protein